MWSIAHTKNGSPTFVGQEEHLVDAVRIAQMKANAIRAVFYVYKGNKHCTVIHPQRKEIKCSTS